MDEINSLEEQFQRVKNNLTKVKSTVEKLDKYLENFEIIRNKLDDPENWLEKSLEWSTNQKNQINELYSEASNTLQKLKEEIKETSSQVVSVEQLIESAKKQTTESQTISKEISELKSSSTNNTNSIASLMNKSQDWFDTINSLLDNAKKNVEEIKKFLETFNLLKSQIEDEENGFEAIIQAVNENLTQSDSLLKQIEIIRTNSNKNLVEIEKEKETIQWISKEISDIREESEKDRKEIANYLAIASDASFAESFNKRKLELSNNAKLWRKFYLWAIIWLVIYLFIVFWSSIFWGTIPGVEESIFRLTLSSPIIFLIWFSGLEYSKNRANEEKYAFKFATSTVFRNHIKFMLEEFWADKKDSVLETTQKIIDVLYTPTYSSEEKLSEIEKNIIKTHFKDTSTNKSKREVLPNFDELIDRAKKIKDIIWTDQEILKIVLPFLFK